MRIRRNGTQTLILDRTTDGEMIEALPIVAGQTERAVQHIIEITTNAGAANTGSLGSQIPLSFTARNVPLYSSTFTKATQNATQASMPE
jgi:hypothetical protein